MFIFAEASSLPEKLKKKGEPNIFFGRKLNVLLLINIIFIVFNKCMVYSRREGGGEVVYL